MAINKDRNVNLQITFPKEDANHLEVMCKSFQEEGVNCTKSLILLKAFREYLKMIIASGAILEVKDKMQETIKQEAEARKEKKDA